MPGFPSELGSSIRQRHDRQLEHLSLMCAILDMIEHMGVGDEITITALSLPGPPNAGNVAWSIQHSSLEGTKQSTPPIEASRLLMREIEQRTDETSHLPTSIDPA